MLEPRWKKSITGPLGGVRSWQELPCFVVVLWPLMLRAAGVFVFARCGGRGFEVGVSGFENFGVSFVSFACF